MFFGNGHSPFSNPFESDGFFEPRRKKIEPKVIHIPVTLKELYHGTKKKITLTLKNMCAKCNGHGGLNVKKCYDCDGRGIKIINRMIGPGMMQRMQMPCNTCNGSKNKYETVCILCNGNGTGHYEKQFILPIEAGAKNNEQKVFENAGDESIEDGKGDVIFIIKEEKHSLFHRYQQHLVYYHTLTLGESIVGTEFSLTHLNDTILWIKEENMIPEKSYSVVKNKGMPNAHNGYGDLYIVYSIQYPTQKLSSVEKETIKHILSIPTKSTVTQNSYVKSDLRLNFILEEFQQKHRTTESSNSHGNHPFRNIHNMFGHF